MQERKDYEYLQDKYGYPHDLCGAVCNTELLFDILKGKTSRSQAYIHLIGQYFDRGIDDATSSGKKLIINDKRTQKIKDKYGF